MFPHFAEMAKDRFPEWLKQPTRLNSFTLGRAGGEQHFIASIHLQPDTSEYVYRLLEGNHYINSNPSRRDKVYKLPVATHIDALPISWLLWDERGSWYVFPEDPNMLVPRLTGFFAALFCFGSLARYYPRQWISLIEGRDSLAVQVVDRFINLAIEEVPFLVLNELSDKYIKLGPTIKML